MDLSGLMPQQRDIVTTLDRPLFVSAGAGSGKTFTLTRRILWALSPESGPYLGSLDQVLAITFTRDAAAEIRERVRGALVAEGMEREALAVDDAWISTIHGMCARILRAHALELGLDPEFGILGDTDELMDRAVDDALRRRAGKLDALMDAFELDARGDGLRALVRRVLELASASREGFEGLEFIRGRADLSGMADAYQALAENGTKKGAELAAGALAAIQAYEEGGRTWEDLVALMAACEKMPVKSAGFPAESVAWLKAEVADAMVNAVVASDEATGELMDLSREVYEGYTALKRERSVLDNNDLLHLAYAALRDHEELRRMYAGRFRLVMIDEFQDTDQQQVDLISFLSGTDARALATVGDAQQSIYRFRGAEVQVFHEQRARVEAVAAAREDGGRVVELVKNFRSHAEVLRYVARVFDGEDGGLMPRFLNLLPHEGRADGLAAVGASRKQAFLVLGRTGEARTAAVAEGIAKRFRALADAGQPVGGMVVLLGAMTRADVYADAIRAQGMNCVIAGGSVFAGTVEARSVRALARTLANPLDAAEGLVPLLQSPIFALGAQEFLALATKRDPATGETSRRNVEEGILSDEDAPGLEGLPLLARAREVLRRALSRVGRDPLAAIARDVVNESGWLVRLEAAGAQGLAGAANALKALDALAEAEAEVGRSPRAIARAYDRFLAGKQAPGALNGAGGDAVRIMTVHASKGLEFPVVAVAECYTARPSSDRMQVRRGPGGSARIACIPARFPGARTEAGWVPGDKVRDLFRKKYLASKGAWLSPELVDDVCASDSIAAAWLGMRSDELVRDLEERARLLYVAMTRAREVCILAMEGKVGTSAAAPYDPKPDADLTPRVLERILPEAAGRLDVDRLVFEDSREGDFELVALDDFSFAGESYAANAEVAEAEAEPEGPDSFTLAWPRPTAARVLPAPPASRDSYSYSSVAAALHAAGEDRGVPAGALAAAGDTVAGLNADALPPEAAPGSRDEPAPVAPRALEVVDAAGYGEGSGAAEPATAPAGTADGDPTALGSAFHALAQWMVEMGASEVPIVRAEAQVRAWGVTPAQRERLDAMLARWGASAVRAEALSWPRVRAEVPFFSMGSTELAPRFGAFVEGAIDLLCDDPADPSRALAIDYKTGGSADEAPEALREKHRLQAEVYADVLHRAGYKQVVLKFVRVEVPDSREPTEPQVVTYEL